MDPQVTTIPKEQLQKLNKLCFWLALQSFGAKENNSTSN